MFALHRRVELGLVLKEPIALGRVEGEGTARVSSARVIPTA
jgi:hypothetical protein